MKQNIKRIWNIVSSIIVALAVLLAILLVGVRIFGVQVFTVLSGSMEPEYRTGSLIYVRAVDPFALETGDDITFMLNADTVATHRIVEIVPDADDPAIIRFGTQGIANETPDGTLVHYKNVIGSPVFTIPYLGYLSAFIQEPPGTYVAISVGAILILLVFLPDLLLSEEDPKNQKTKSARQKTSKSSGASAAATSVPKSAAPQNPRPPQTLTPAQLEQLSRKLTPEQMTLLRRRMAQQNQNDDR